MVWRSPAGQPRWARPILLILAAVAGVAYGWRMGSSIEIYYAAAARSMSMSWHDFAYAAFDPAGTISVDKLPGALVDPSAVCPALWGSHLGHRVAPGRGGRPHRSRPLPSRASVSRRRWPAIVAAAVLAVSPAAVTLDRGNISDTLLVLLLVLAADALVAAMLTGRRWGCSSPGCGWASPSRRRWSRPGW